MQVVGTELFTLSKPLVTATAKKLGNKIIFLMMI